jgi:hypothetical protein
LLFVEKNLHCGMPEQTWSEFISQFGVPEVMAALPPVSQSTVYAWRTGDREPPKSAQRAYRIVLEESKTAATA